MTASDWVLSVGSRGADDGGFRYLTLTDVRGVDRGWPKQTQDWNWARKVTSQRRCQNGPPPLIGATAGVQRPSRH